MRRCLRLPAILLTAPAVHAPLHDTSSLSPPGIGTELITTDSLPAEAARHSSAFHVADAVQPAKMIADRKQVIHPRSGQHTHQVGAAWQQQHCWPMTGAMQACMLLVQAMRMLFGASVSITARTPSGVALLNATMAHGRRAAGLEHHTCINMPVLHAQVAGDFIGTRSVRRTGAVVMAQLRRLATD